jgi:glycosyltransferase involved in cell wall biosynthesis
MKRILMIIPNLDFGGAQKSFAAVSRLLSIHHELLLVVFNKDNIAPLDFGTSLIDLNVRGSGTYFGKVISFIKRIRRLKKIKKDFKPEVSISFLEGADYVNFLSKGEEKIWFYIHGSKIHDRNIKGFIGFLRKKFFLPFCLARANKILVVNNQIRKELIHHFSVTDVPITAMRNFFDLSEIDQQAQKVMPEQLTNLFSNYSTICISGRISHEKGIDRFIRILPIVLNRVNHLKVIIVGEGPHKENVISACKNEKMEWCFVDEDVAPSDFSKTVFFLGYRKNPYLFMKRASLLALPSLNEGMPNTIAEALILGTPIVASDCPYGPREMLTDEDDLVGGEWPIYAKYGVLLPIPDQSDRVTKIWAETIIKLLESSEQRQKYSKKGLTLRHSFSQEAMQNEWNSLLEGV